MQIRKPVIQDWCKAHDAEMPSREELFKPEVNLEIGCWHLARTVSHWEGYANQIALALCEYNAGRTRLLRWISHYRSIAEVLKNSPSARYAHSVIAVQKEYESSGTLNLPLLDRKSSLYRKSMNLWRKSFIMCPQILDFPEKRLSVFLEERSRSVLANLRK